MHTLKNISQSSEILNGNSSELHSKGASTYAGRRFIPYERPHARRVFPYAQQSRFPYTVNRQPLEMGLNSCDPQNNEESQITSKEKNPAKKDMKFKKSIEKSLSNPLETIIVPNKIRSKDEINTQNQLWRIKIENLLND